MATCPSCGASSRSDPDAITLSEVLVVPDTFPLNASLPGFQMKASAQRVSRLACRCGWSIDGRIEGEEFLGDPSTQRFPEKTDTATEGPDQR